MKQAFILTVALSILLAACGQPAPEALPGAIDTAVAQTFAALPTDTKAPTETNVPTNTPAPTATATPEFTFPAGAECVPADTEIQEGLVTHVVDGDTIDVDIDGQVYRVRYIGMDTPENTSQVEYFGVEATIRNSMLVDGKTVILVKDVSETDQYDRLLRYVFVDEIFVNLDLVENGFATAATYPPDVA